MGTLKQHRWIGFAVAGAVLALLVSMHWRGAQSAVIPHTYHFEPRDLAGWQAFGGAWEMANGALQSHSNERGAKLLTGSGYWRNYTVSSDIRFDGTSADMGVIVRSNDESRGVDAFDGYYVGLRSLDETLVIGRANYGWVEARPVPMPGGVHPAEWYRLRVTAYGCNIAASAQNLRTLETAWIAFEERSCVRAGRIGLRSLNPGVWRNVNVAPSALGDYSALQKHADSVEQPVVLNGPPWWTPWHVGVLFVCALALALLIQLTYFRVQRWKHFTIVQERERLAHEIHDTMAQSFAGVGYQIQGVRSSFLRGDPQSASQIPDQLNVAYQLVRRCHEDASRTIAMLGSSTPEIQDDLLNALERTAQRMAGEGIRTITERHGDKITLNLRTADALLHIGQEAIANAIAHANPSVLKISLSSKDNFVELIIEDDGDGFEYNSESEGFGILGMQKRVRGISGAIEILSTPREGTKVRVLATLQQRSFKRRVIRWATKSA